jgi:hypothetical protein
MLRSAQTGPEPPLALCPRATRPVLAVPFITNLRAPLGARPRPHSDTCPADRARCCTAGAHEQPGINA